MSYEKISRRAFVTGLCGSAALLFTPHLLNASNRGIVTHKEELDRENQVFITRAKEGEYLAKIVTAKEVTGKTFAMTKEILEATGAFICFNGSFFEHDGSPSGLYVGDRREIHPFFHRKGDGVLYIDRNRQIHIIPKYDLSKHRDHIVDAVQINLFTSGDMKFYEDKEYRKEVPRNFIGITDDGIVDVIYKDTNFTYGDRYMREAHGCIVVGALDGGGSASAIDMLGNTSYDETQNDSFERPVANAILLYER